MQLESQEVIEKVQNWANKTPWFNEAVDSTLKEIKEDKIGVIFEQEDEALARHWVRLLRWYVSVDFELHELSGQKIITYEPAQSKVVEKFMNDFEVGSADAESCAEQLSKVYSLLDEFICACTRVCGTMAATEAAAGASDYELWLRRLAMRTSEYLPKQAGVVILDQLYIVSEKLVESSTQWKSLSCIFAVMLNKVVKSPVLNDEDVLDTFKRIEMMQEVGTMTKRPQMSFEQAIDEIEKLDSF